VEPRLDLTGASRRVQPFIFAHGGRVVDYDVSICCSIYPASSNGRGWLLGAGFGVLTAPAGPVRFDVSAGVHHLSGQTPDRQLGTWRGAGPVLDVRVGASIDLVRRSVGSE
jgi:hypothetical protein